MNYAAIYSTSTGLVVAMRAAETLDTLDAGYAYFPVDAATNALGMQIVNGALVAVPVPLPTLQARAWAAAKAYRTTKTAAGCLTPLGAVQTDPASRDAIKEAAGDAANSQLTVPAWSTAWVMTDNSIKTHSAAQMIALAAAVRTYVAACQAASQAIRTKIYAATTGAAVAAIDITAGYPASS